MACLPPAASPGPASAVSPEDRQRLRAPVDAALWRASELGARLASVVSSGWDRLDSELPGGGWPCQAVTEVLTPQPAVVEWRLLGPALRSVVAAGGQVVAVAPPRPPYLPGLLHEGLDERRFVWVQAETAAERLWAAEQLVKADACGALVAWLPQVRPEQLRRLQTCAQGHEGPVFLCRPEGAQHEASAAPLRVHASCGLDWQLQLRILKRRGPALDGSIALPSMPGGLASIVTPRLLEPSRLFSREVSADVVGRPAVSLRPRRHATAH